EEAGLSNPLWGTSAALLDYNRDGWLDLVVVNYLDYDPKKDCLTAQGTREFCGPMSFPGTCSKLFRNCGPAPAAGDKPAARVRFGPVSCASGRGGRRGWGVGGVGADLAGDGGRDFLGPTAGRPTRLWITRHDGTFADEAASRGVAYTATGKSYSGMGVA